MCGINGIFAYSNQAPPVDLLELGRTRDAMQVRGPDGFGTWCSNDGRIGLGHRRLAIIEISELGAQPMHTSDGQLSITFNGEIYNHQELREKLVAKGFVFRSHSDTEVLLHLYRDCGVEMVKQLRGMFAFGLWDNKNRKLILARDPYGIKPLYYCNKKGVIRFASQVKALLAGGAITPDINPAGAVSFLLWGSVSEPLTLYENIEMLPAGHILEIEQSRKLSFTQYWNITNTIENSCIDAEKIPVSESLEYSINAIRESIKLHMVADVPIGSFLSAGLDSTAITGIANELSKKPIESITLGFNEFKGKNIDEVPGASEIAKILGVNHHIILASLSDIEDELPAFFSAMDQPTIDGLNTWFVSKAASQAGLKVVLSGLGGDEFLGGYSTFKNIPTIVNNSTRLSSLPLAGDLFFYLHKFLAENFKHFNPNGSGYYKMGRTLEGAYQLERGLFMPWHLHHILDRDFAQVGLQKLSNNYSDRKTTFNAKSSFCKIVELESSNYMRNQLLRDTDWIGMAHSLEIRVPFVDHILLGQLVGLAATGRLGQGKSILANSLMTTLPDNILNRPKTGFTIPIWRYVNNSSHFSAWKNNSFLQRKNSHEYKRWAYCILEQWPGINNVLK